MIAEMAMRELPPGYSVTPNARLLGRISKRSRQIDVLIDLRHERDDSGRLIVDAKKRTRKVDVKDVEAFRGLMDDVGATHGYLVCPNGFTKAAVRRAQTAVSVRLVPLDQLEDFDPATWPKCEAAACGRGRVFWDGYPEIGIPVAPMTGEIHGQVRTMGFVHHVGKCDRCGTFHVKCLACHDVFDVPDDDNGPDRRCSCEPPWFWLASIEENERGFKFAELHCVSIMGSMLTADRRALQ
jgi:hypothetical protein